MESEAGVALIPAPHNLIVSPSLVEEGEDETQSGLHIVRHHRPKRQVWRGVCEAVGSHLANGEWPSVGDAVIYTDFIAVGELHVVPDAHIACWDVSG